MDFVKRIWYLSPMRAAKVQANLRMRAVSPEPPLLAYTGSESRGTVRQKARSLASLNGWECAVKIYHDWMLEDTNLLDGAHIQYIPQLICLVILPIPCFVLQSTGYMEAAVPYSSVEDVHIISRWDAGQKFCIRITISDGSLLLQVRSFLIWVGARQNQQNQLCDQRRLRSAWAFAQGRLWSDWADLIFTGRTYFVGYVVLRHRSYFHRIQNIDFIHSQI